MCPDAPDARDIPPHKGEPFPAAHGWREIVDTRVRAAFARVARQHFVPTELRAYAHRDEPLPIGEGQTVSQPFVIAVMLQALALEPGQRVLEIGTGSGYQTALLCEVVHAGQALPGAEVYSVERFETLLRRAAKALQQAGYHPHLKPGDGALGWPAHAPYDGIVVSAAAPRVPRPLVDQLAEGGRLVIPVGAPESDQELWLIERVAGRLEWTALGPVRFVPFVSSLFADPERQVRPPDSGQIHPV